MSSHDKSSRLGTPPLAQAVGSDRQRRDGSQTQAQPSQASDDFKAQLAGFSLTTAEILYRMPDHPTLLQTYVWQEYDAAPRFPRLTSFLEFWVEKLEGPLYKVTVASTALIRPAELKLIGAEFRLH